MTDQTVENEGTDFDAEASEMGWVPKEKFKGGEDKWVDSKTFVERGEHILPIVKANNERLKKDLLTRDQKIASLETAVKDATSSIKALQKSYTAATELAVEQAKKELRAQLKVAKTEGDIDAELELEDKLEELKDKAKAAKEANAEDKEEKVDPANALAPWFVDWIKQNTWYDNQSSDFDRKRTRALTRIAEDLRDDGEIVTGTKFMDMCMDILEEQEGKKKGPERKGSKVETGTNGSRSSGSGGFASLSKEAKDICHADNDKFVGPGKMFKTVGEWETHFYNMVKED